MKTLLIALMLVSLNACVQKKDPVTPVPPTPKTSEAGPQMGSLPSTTPQDTTAQVSPGTK